MCATSLLECGKTTAGASRVELCEESSGSRQCVTPKLPRERRVQASYGICVDPELVDMCHSTTTSESPQGREHERRRHRKMLAQPVHPWLCHQFPISQSHHPWLPRCQPFQRLPRCMPATVSCTADEAGDTRPQVGRTEGVWDAILALPPRLHPAHSM